jgi:hypothetical protein
VWNRFFLLKIGSSFLDSCEYCNEPLSSDNGGKDYLRDCQLLRKGLFNGIRGWMYFDAE